VWKHALCFVSSIQFTHAPISNSHVDYVCQDMDDKKIRKEGRNNCIFISFHFISFHFISFHFIPQLNWTRRPVDGAWAICNLTHTVDRHQ
jgi:hypothetical protein